MNTYLKISLWFFKSLLFMSLLNSVNTYWFLLCFQYSASNWECNDELGVNLVPSISAEYFIIFILYSFDNVLLINQIFGLI